MTTASSTGSPIGAAPAPAPQPAPPAPAGRGESIEANLRRLAVTALVLFGALAATLFLVQIVLGRQLNNLAHRALVRQSALNSVEAAVGALFRRQAQVLST